MRRTRHRRIGRLAAGIAVAASLCASHAGAAPQRIVSIHLCGDQLALALADPAQIASLSRFARDRARSYMAEAAEGIPLNNGLAEEVVRFEPDLVLAGALSGRTTVQALRALGYPVLDLGLPASLEAIRDQTMQAAKAFGHEARGRVILAEMDARLAHARAGRPEAAPVALVWQPHSFASGPGSLEHEFLVAAGFRDLAEELGLGALGRVPLERLVRQRPALVVNWMGDEGTPSLARELFDHPALKHGATRRIETIPQRLWTCPGWFSVDAVERLAAARRALTDGATP
ncbi:MAG: ABC transporter substrate-binding protein [Alphaproteobacteria bacterium]|nr:ABC transporter substrate-binding protein [Alphaproteobacteria bacterium]